MAASDLADRRVVIAGGTGSVGEGIVRAWLRSGANVVVPSRSESRLEDVRRAVGWRVPLSFRSGGHGMSGSSVNDGGIVLDISSMRSIQVVDSAQGLVRVQAGATWGDVAGVLQPHDLVITSGNFGDTGVGGLATSGGVGFFVRSQGLTIDRIRGARIITADGTSRWVDAEHDADLFWAVRGGGSQVGIVTEFLFQAQRLHSRNRDASVINQMAQYLTTDLPGFVASWGEWIAEAPAEMVSFLMLYPVNDGRVSIQAINVWAGSDVERATRSSRPGQNWAGSRVTRRSSRRIRMWCQPLTRSMWANSTFDSATSS